MQPRTEQDRQDLMALPGDTFGMREDFSNVWELTRAMHDAVAGKINVSGKPINCPLRPTCLDERLFVRIAIGRHRTLVSKLRPDGVRDPCARWIQERCLRTIPERDTKAITNQALRILLGWGRIHE